MGRQLMSNRSKYESYNREQLISQLQRFEKQLDEKEHFFAHYKEQLATVLLEKDKTIEELYLERLNTEFVNFIGHKIDALVCLENTLSAYYLENKKHSAVKEGKRIREITNEYSDLNSKYLLVKYQLNQVLTLFPHALKYIDEDFTSLEDTSIDETKNYISIEEWNSLKSFERSNLIIKRYKAKKKSNAEIGRDYERYVGFRMESIGFEVIYNGILNGLCDEGIDLLCSSKKYHIAVQCKNWSKEKCIHEKHLAQIYGSAYVHYTERNISQYKCMLWTSTQISERAKQFASLLEVELIENQNIEDYPMIKCIPNDHSEMIYHLPTDLQYDRIIMSGNRFYCEDAEEAEKLGFRHAYKWRGKS